MVSAITLDVLIYELLLVNNRVETVVEIIIFRFIEISVDQIKQILSYKE